MLIRALVLLVVAGVFTSCKPARPEAPRTGAYGMLTNAPASEIPRVRPDSPGEPWTNSRLSVIETELSPATLWHSTATSLTFFAGMPASGMGGPGFAAISTQKGPRIFAPGSSIEPEMMRESWFVVWWAGATNWTHWDSPWFLTLQQRPASIHLDTNGLHFTFHRPAGYAALMPMYGYYKPLPAGQESSPFAQLKEKKKRILTWEWHQALPADPLARARYWASALKEFPVYAEESFSINRAHDSVVVRQNIRFISWNDDWQTKPLKLAPLSPVLALAAREGFPVEFSKKPFDMEILTPQGPLYGVEGVDAYDITLPVLRYVNEAEVLGGEITNSSPVAVAALERLRATIRNAMEERPPFGKGGPNSAADYANAQWFARALPLLEPAARTRVASELSVFFRQQVLPDSGVRELPAMPAATSSMLLQSVWAYAHFTGDWALVRERWPLIASLFLARPATWTGFGDGASTPFADEAAMWIAAARVSYGAGEIDAYHYACHRFAQTLAHHWVKHRGARYFRENQPWHSMENMPEEVYVNFRRNDMEGWQIDGPKYPRTAAERPFEQRWARFNDPDLARFHRVNLPADVKRELDALQQRWPSERQATNEPHEMPSLVQLRSLLLNEKLEALAARVPPNQFRGTPGGTVASCYALLRSSVPIRHERLIPGAAAAPFVAGAERTVAGPNTVLVQSIRTEPQGAAMWPRPTWPTWRSPSGEAWNFGSVRIPNIAPGSTRVIPLNWNSRAVLVGD